MTDAFTDLTAAPLDRLLPIDPKTAIAKFLVDMRLVSERSWRRWHKVLTEVLVECALPQQARRMIMETHPVEDYYFAGITALQACRIREMFPFSVAEALMRELALQVDPAVGRDDGAISNLVFITLGRIRKARAVENFRDHDQVVEAMLERMGVGLHSATAAIMTSLPVRHRLAEPLALAAPDSAMQMWWDSFIGIYAVDAPVLKPLPRRADVAPAPSPGERWRSVRPAHAARDHSSTGFSFAAWLKNMARPRDESRPD